MEKLRSRHENITWAHQIVVCDDGFVIGMMQEAFTWYNRGIAACRFVPRMWMVSVVKIFLCMRIGIIEDIAEIDFELVILFFDERMHDLYPVCLVSLNLLERMTNTLCPIGRFQWGFAEKLAVPWSRRCEDNASHKPRGWDFAQEDQQNGAKLPSTEFSIDALDDVQLFHAAIVCD